MEGAKNIMSHNFMNKYGCWVFLLLLFLQGCSPEDGVFDGRKKQIPDQTIHGFMVTEMKSGIKEWKLIAERADIYQRRNETELFKLRMKFYNNEEEVTSTLTADEGKVNNKTNDVIMKGNVIVISEEKKTKLTTESLRWDAGREKLLSDDFIRQEDEDVIVTGYGLEVDSRLGRVLIKKDVKVEQKVKKE